MWLAHYKMIPPIILSRYGSALADLNWIPITSGFSGADVWRGDDAGGEPRFALKGWPPQTNSRRVAQIHAWMKQVAHLSFVPTLLRTVEGDEIVEDENRIWDVTKWLPGVPRILPNKREVGIACQAVAELHIAWSHVSQHSSCPGVARRIDVLKQWLSNPHSSAIQFQPELAGLLTQARAILERTVSPALCALQPWSDVSMLLHPCARDLRGDHVLYVGEKITGIVDYGAMDIDAPAIDLARLLGDLVGENEELFAVGLGEYRRFRSNFDVGDELIRLLDRVGVICSIIGWFARLSDKHQQISGENVKNRLSHLIFRVEQFQSF